MESRHARELSECESSLKADLAALEARLTASRSEREAQLVAAQQESESRAAAERNDMETRFLREMNELKASTAAEAASNERAWVEERHKLEKAIASLQVCNVLLPLNLFYSYLFSPSAIV
jgi:hypothetical protein